MSTALLWFRRDFRLADNPALRHALERHDEVLPVYIHAPDEEAPWQPGAASRWWLHHSLAALAESLKRLGAPLVIRHGRSLDELRALIKTTKAEAVYWNRLYEPAVIARDKIIKQALREDGLRVESFNSALMIEPWEIKTGTGDPYRVFTPFWRNALARPVRAPLPAPRKWPLPTSVPKSLLLDSLQLLPRIDWDGGLRETWTPGEKGAWKRLEVFVENGIEQYRQKRDEPAVEANSSLSAHLHFGEIGPVQIVARTRQVLAENHAAGLIANVDHFVRELGWREFAHHLLFHFPETVDTPLSPKFKAFPWRGKPDYADDLKAWQAGQTGVPIVDAGVRQLWRTGVMHNRVRMIAASFLTKNLLIPWDEGARWFWNTLVDASLANNTLGWQWVAGCGADAAPYFRIFNPALQSAKFDTAGAYLRQWLPELRKLPDDALHAPWNAKPVTLLAAGFSLGRDYPHPIVDVAASRDRALSAYGQIRSG